MKKVLSVIGGFFVAIWRWIKETAWVQPLIIVGIIFGVIFSIPAVVDWANAIEEKNNSAETYYRKFRQSLLRAENSAADKLINEIKDNSDGESDSLANQKFFLAFISKDCESCKQAREGFEYFISNSSILAKDNRSVNLKTIFVDEDSDWEEKNKEDWKKDNTVTVDNAASTAFGAFLDRNFAILEGLAADIENTDFYLNGGITDAQKEDFTSGKIDSFVTPTILLVDFAGEGKSGVTNVMVGFNGGSSKLERSTYLANAWNYEGRFGPNYTA